MHPPSAGEEGELLVEEEADAEGGTSSLGGVDSADSQGSGDVSYHPFELLDMQLLIRSRHHARLVCSGSSEPPHRPVSARSPSAASGRGVRRPEVNHADDDDDNERPCSLKVHLEYHSMHTEAFSAAEHARCLSDEDGLQGTMQAA